MDGVLDGRWSEWFQGLQIDNQGGETILSGTLPDQPALHGILDKVRDLGLSIITVRRIPPEGKAAQDETHPQPTAKQQAERRWLAGTPPGPRDHDIVRPRRLRQSRPKEDMRTVIVMSSYRWTAMQALASPAHPSIAPPTSHLRSHCSGDW